MISTRFVCMVLGLAVAVTPVAAQRGASSVRRRSVDPSLGEPELFRSSSISTPGSSAIRKRTFRPAIVLTGYWPPSNEAIRCFNTDPVQNPGGWIGKDWEGRGYDVHAFFPEFPTPGDAKGTGTLEVDYQDTVHDFWPIVERLQPIAVITLSRGASDYSWELEMNQYNRSVWANDMAPPFQPTPAPPDPTVPAEYWRPSTLPVQAIVDAINHSPVSVSPFVCYAGNGGGFLSEFIAYLGVWYQGMHATPGMGNLCAAAGHVHVGELLSTTTAREALFVTLRTVMTYVDQVTLMNGCQPDLGFGGPGFARLAMCGMELSSGSRADLTLGGAPANAPVWLLVSPSFRPMPALGGTLVPIPASHVLNFQADSAGNWTLPGIAGGGGPRSLFVQAIYLDATSPRGVGITNALRVDWLP